MLGRVILAVLVALGVSATAVAQDTNLSEIDFGRYHALVIGNNDYQHLPKLHAAVGDAAATAELLRGKYGFDVKLLVDATRLDILKALNVYRRNLTERDNLLIYYAGHGVLDKETETGFWLPVEAAKDSDEFWIANADLTRRLKSISAKHVLVVADSCYSGTLLREAPAALPSGTERTAWLQRMNRLASRTALVSGGLEPVVDSGSGGHSVFANAFLAALRDNSEVLDGQALFTKVSRPVALNADQTPRYSDIRRAGHEGGEFMFVPRDVTVSATVRPPPTVQSDREVVFWQSIQGSDDPAGFRAYLEVFPEGTFAPLARSRLKTTEQKRTALVIPPKPTVEIDPVEATYVAVKNANVRAEPTVSASKVANLKRGTKVHVAGKVKGQNWYLVERDDKHLGYVYGELLRDAETVRQEEEAQQREAQRKRAEEAKRQEAERKRAEQSKLALALPSKPQAPSTTKPAVGVYPSAREPGDSFRDCADCPTMVVIPAGSFVMGSPASEEGRAKDEGPQHRVTIPQAFALGKYEVTFSEWDACVQAGGCSHRPKDEGWGRGNRPVINVSWSDAREYVRWLAHKTGSDYRLPSEAEWEYAARAGTTTARYWDKDADRACGYGNVRNRAKRSEYKFDWGVHDCRDGYAKTAPVGSFRANDFGLHDVLANVWEWVEDCWNDNYEGAPSDGSAWAAGKCKRRVLRGGSWFFISGDLRAADRVKNRAEKRNDDSGFRVARTLP